MSAVTTKTLVNHHAVVTGGARGIGYAIAQQLLACGARVTIMGRSEQSLRDAYQTLATFGELEFESVDVTQGKSVTQGFERAQARFGPIDILVNNAGQAVSERFDRIDAHQWQQMMDVNLTGTFNCMQAVLPSMLQRQWGRIVNVASTAGLIGYAYVSAYCAAKHGVIGLTRALALEVATKGITVNAVCPGYTETHIVADAIATIQKRTGRSEHEARAQLTARNPQGRLVQPEDVARTVVWLCQHGAESINGQSIPVDGGEVMAG